VTEDIFELSSTIVDELAALMPTLATTAGISGYDHLWDDYSPEGQAEIADALRDQLRRVGDVEHEGDPWAALAVRVVVDELERGIDDFDHDEHLRDLNSIASPAQDLRDVFEQMGTETVEDWENIVSRLEALPAAAAGFRQRLELGRSRGLAVAKRQVIEVSRQMRNNAGADSPFVAFPGRLEASGAAGSVGLEQRLLAALPRVREAFDEFASYLEETYLPDAAPEDGVGIERYRRLAGRFLGTDIDPVATYEWGWSEVERLRERMETVAGEISEDGDLKAALDVLLNDPSRAASSQDEFRQLMLERQQIALSELDGVHFDVPDEIKEIDVQMTPPGGSLGAYYYQPSEDFSRPGTVFWSKGDQQQIPLFDEVSTAYHEGFPGHHLQVGLQMTAGDRFSRMHKLLIWYSGSGEGWALYAEDLMEELGYLEKPDYVMGKLASEMLRACRVVIDIGSHLDLPIPGGQPFHPGERWSFDLGVEMLVDYAAQDHAIAVSEMNRYLGWAGQAISYKVGQQAIRDLRVEAERDPGYDQKAFHARLLEVGAVGLDVLRDHMR